MHEHTGGNEKRNQWMEMAIGSVYALFSHCLGIILRFVSIFILKQDQFRC
jgi:hypothetical protein